MAAEPGAGGHAIACEPSDDDVRLGGRDRRRRLEAEPAQSHEVAVAQTREGAEEDLERVSLRRRAIAVHPSQSVMRLTQTTHLSKKTDDATVTWSAWPYGSETQAGLPAVIPSSKMVRSSDACAESAKAYANQPTDLLHSPRA